MAYLVLARKYRPQTFADVIEQKQTTQTLINAITGNRVAHAILFSGPRGTGKTTIARILAKAMNCEQGPTPTPCNQCRSCLEITSGNAADVYEIDGASNNSVDQVRELRSNIKFMPAHSPYKIYIIDEVHMLTASAFNALLKTLEEPPPHVMFAFATTEPHKIPMTILSRCQRHDLSYVSFDAIVNHLARLCEEEGYQAEKRSLELIAREAGGSIRDALSLLDQVMSCTDTLLTHDHVVDILGITSRESLFALSDAALRRSVPDILAVIDEMHRGGMDIKKLYGELMAHFRDLLVFKLGKDLTSSAAVPSHEIEMIRQQVEKTTDLHLNRILTIFLNEEKTIRFSSHPKIALEMTFLKICQLQPVLPINTLIEKIDGLKDQFLTLGDHSQDQSDTPSPASPADARQGCSPAGGQPAPPNDSARRQSDSAGIDSTDADIETDSPPATDRTATADMSPDEAWQAILDIVDDGYSLLAANLKDSSLSAVRDHELVIDIYGSKINMEILRQEKNQNTLKKICSAFYKKEMDIRMNHRIKPETVKPKQAPRRRSGIHPLVMDALDIFGGDIVNNRP